MNNPIREVMDQFKFEPIDRHTVQQLQESLNNLFDDIEFIVSIDNNTVKIEAIFNSEADRIIFKLKYGL